MAMHKMKGKTFVIYINIEIFFRKTHTDVHLMYDIM